MQNFIFSVQINNFFCQICTKYFCFQKYVYHFIIFNVKNQPLLFTPKQS